MTLKQVSHDPALKCRAKPNKVPLGPRRRSDVWGISHPVQPWKDFVRWLRPSSVAAVQKQTGLQLAV